MKYKDDFPDLLKHPPLTYAKYIAQKVWDEFVAKRLTPKWKAIQKVQQGSRANKYKPA